MKEIYDKKHLTMSQRILIEKGLCEQKTFAQIAREIDKSPSTISKEVKCLLQDLMYLKKSGM